MSEDVAFQKFKQLTESSERSLYANTICNHHISKIDAEYIHSLCLHIIDKLYVKELNDFWKIQDIVQMTVQHKDSFVTRCDLIDRIKLNERVTFNRLIYIEGHVVHYMDKLSVLDVYEFLITILCIPDYDYTYNKDNKLHHILLGHIYRSRMTTDLNIDHEMSVDLLYVKNLIVSIIQHINSYISSYSKTEDWIVYNISTLKYTALICITVMLSRTTNDIVISKLLNTLERKLIASSK